MSQKLPCSKCGVPILESTALRTDGLCMPCKGGYRESIEEGKRHNREQLEEMLTDPYRKLWVSLVEKVYHSPTGFDGLSHPQKLYFAVCLLEGEVCNGGFHQYFFNAAGSYYAYAEEGLIALGAFQTLELLQEARDAVFPSIPVPTSIAERRRALSSYPEDSSPTPKWSEKLDDLDKRFWADPDGITLRLETFARNHGLLSIAE
ncbi:MAG: DMP19 family protein [Terriglobales bacterium]|jgi:hypothetical protein